MPNIHLKDLPLEIRQAVLKKQAEIKAAKNVGKFSQTQTIVSIIREWMKLKHAS